MGYTISIKDISYNQMREINNKLATFGNGLSATSVDDKGDRWNVSVTTGDFNTKQVFWALTAVLAQSVAIPYYTIDQLASDVQKQVCQAAIDANIYWDTWQDERNHSFSAICDKLDLQWSCDNYDNYYVEETRTNKALFTSCCIKKVLPCLKSILRMQCPLDTVRTIAFMRRMQNF